MCVVIDINTLPPVFNPGCKLHNEFAPVKDWIAAGLGFVVFGGTNYKAELGRAFRYLRLIRQMRDGGQAVSIRDDAVDLLEESVKRKTRQTNCDDQHIIALLGASRCSLLCSGDRRSFKFVKDRKLYPKGMSRVSVYTSGRNKKLLIKMSKNSLKNVEN